MIITLEQATAWRDKHGNPNGTPYEQGQWDMAQRFIAILNLDPELVNKAVIRDEDGTIIGRQGWK